MPVSGRSRANRSSSGHVSLSMRDESDSAGWLPSMLVGAEPLTLASCEAARLLQQVLK